MVHVDPDSRASGVNEFKILDDYSTGKITASEAKMELQCNRWELLEKMANAGLPLPRLPREQANAMAKEALAVLNSAQKDIDD